MRATDNTDDRVTVNQIFRVPSLWPQRNVLCFAVLEAQFKTARITTDTTKFARLTGSFEGQYLEQVEDIVINLPSTGRYEKLKSELIRRVADSDGTRVRKMLECEEMGDRTPSQFYRDLKKLATPSTPDVFVFMLWRSRLPAYVQYVLSASENTEAENLTQMADRIHETRSVKGRIVAVEAERTDGKRQTRSSNQMQDLVCRLIERMDASRRRRSRSRERTQSSRLCCYHETFRNCARKCRTPCSWNQGKRDQPSVNAACDNGFASRCIFVTDRVSRIPFLMDTGADLCAYLRNKLRGTETRMDCSRPTDHVLRLTAPS